LGAKAGAARALHARHSAAAAMLCRLPRRRRAAPTCTCCRPCRRGPGSGGCGAVSRADGWHAAAIQGHHKPCAPPLRPLPTCAKTSVKVPPRSIEKWKSRPMGPAACERGGRRGPAGRRRQGGPPRCRHASCGPMRGRLCYPCSPAGRPVGLQTPPQAPRSSGAAHRARRPAPAARPAAVAAGAPAAPCARAGAGKLGPNATLPAGNRAATARAARAFLSPPCDLRLQLGNRECHAALKEPRRGAGGRQVRGAGRTAGGARHAQRSPRGQGRRRLRRAAPPAGPLPDGVPSRSAQPCRAARLRAWFATPAPSGA
jgi:hypothetical protein